MLREPGVVLECGSVSVVDLLPLICVFVRPGLSNIISVFNAVLDWVQSLMKI